jgi:hypothetical protein
MPSSIPRFALPVAMLAGLLTAASLPAGAATPPARVAIPRPAGNAAPAITAPDLVTALRQQGAASGRDARGRKPVTTLDYPWGITVDPHSNIYVTNLYAGVTIYNSKYQKTAEITSGLSYPAGIGISFEGNIYVANNGANNVTIYNPQLAQIGTITDSTLASPGSMFIDSDDTAWVLDGQGRLHAYLSDGTVVSSTQTGGTTVGPWGPNVTVWGITYPNGGYVEALEDRAVGVHDGLSLGTFIGDSPYAGGETQDQYGQQYVSDFTNDLIEIWSTDGLDLIAEIPTPGNPIGVAVDDNLHRLYVALTTSDEVYVYSTISPYKLLHVIH